MSSRLISLIVHIIPKELKLFLAQSRVIKICLIKAKSCLKLNIFQIYNLFPFSSLARKWTVSLPVLVSQWPIPLFIFMNMTDTEKSYVLTLTYYTLLPISPDYLQNPMKKQLYFLSTSIMLVQVGISPSCYSNYWHLTQQPQPFW